MLGVGFVTMVLTSLYFIIDLRNLKIMLMVLPRSLPTIIIILLHGEFTLVFEITQELFALIFIFWLTLFYLGTLDRSYKPATIK